MALHGSTPAKREKRWPFEVFLDSRPEICYNVTVNSSDGKCVPVDEYGAIIFLPRDGTGSPLLLENILFDPAALWLSSALGRQGVTQFLVVCDDADRAAAVRCFPEGTKFVTEGAPDASDQLLAFLDALDGRVIVVARPVFLDDQGASRLTGHLDARLPRGEDSGVYVISAAALKTAAQSGADFLTAVRTDGMIFGLSGRNYFGLCGLDRWGATWDSAQYFARRASVDRLHAAVPGNPVRFLDKDTVYIGPQVTVGGGTLILPGTILRGRTSIGPNCVIGPNTMIRDCTIGCGVTINASQLNESTVDDETVVGPFAYVRPNCHIGKGVKVGDFVELKNSEVGDGTKISHLTYVGDTDAGKHINFGCGTVTVNYDGEKKFRTIIGDNAFIGCNTNLVAPVSIGAGAYTAAGSTITDDIPPQSLAIARVRQVVKKQWVVKHRRHTSS